MKKTFLLIIMAPIFAFASGLDMYNAAMLREQIGRSAELVFKNNVEQRVALINGILVDQAADDESEQSFKRDTRNMMVGIGQWQSKNVRNNSDSYVDELYFGREGKFTLVESFRYRELLVELAGRITVALEQERQRQQKAKTENGVRHRLPLFW